MCWAAPASKRSAAFAEEGYVGRDGEVPVPACEAMEQDGRLASRVLEILLRGVSTRVPARAAGDGYERDRVLVQVRRTSASACSCRSRIHGLECFSLISRFAGPAPPRICLGTCARDLLSPWPSAPSRICLVRAETVT